jgi:hypothetical protein
MIRFLFSELMLSGAVAFCFLLVGALVASDWTEKRRARKLRELCAKHRELNQPGSRPLSASFAGARSRPLGRIFRLDLLLLSIVAVAAITAMTRQAKPVYASSASTEAVVSAGTAKSDRNQNPFSVPAADIRDVRFGLRLTETLRGAGDPALEVPLFDLSVNSQAKQEFRQPGFALAEGAALGALFETSSESDADWPQVSVSRGREVAPRFMESNPVEQQRMRLR